jgi:hypothetical protein
VFVEDDTDVIKRVDGLAGLAFKERAVRLRVVADKVGDLLELSGEALEQADNRFGLITF